MVIMFCMELRDRKIGKGYGVILPKSLLEALAVGEGSILKAENRGGVLEMKPLDEEFTQQVEAFLQTEAQHRRSYRELAK